MHGVHGSQGKSRTVKAARTNVYYLLQMGKRWEISMSRLCHVHPRYWNVVVSVRWVRWYQEETNYQTGDE